MDDDYEEEYIIKDDVSEARGSSRSYDDGELEEEIKPRFDYFKYFLPNYKQDGESDEPRSIKNVSASSFGTVFCRLTSVFQCVHLFA